MNFDEFFFGLSFSASINFFLPKLRIVLSQPFLNFKTFILCLIFDPIALHWFFLELSCLLQAYLAVFEWLIRLHFLLFSEFLCSGGLAVVILVPLPDLAIDDFFFWHSFSLTAIKKCSRLVFLCQYGCTAFEILLSGPCDTSGTSPQSCRCKNIALK